MVAILHIAFFEDVIGIKDGVFRVLPGGFELGVGLKFAFLLPRGHLKLGLVWLSDVLVHYFCNIGEVVVILREFFSQLEDRLPVVLLKSKPLLSFPLNQTQFPAQMGLRRLRFLP